VSPFQGLLYICNITQDSALLRPELLHVRALPFKTLKALVDKTDENESKIHDYQTSWHELKKVKG